MDKLDIETELAILNDKVLIFVEPYSYLLKGSYSKISIPVKSLYKYLKYKYYPGDPRFNTFHKITDFYIVKWAIYE